MSQIESSNSNTVVSGTSGNDIIHSRGSNVTVKGLGGNDSIQSNGYNNLIMGGDGNDTIRAGYPNKPDTIEGGKGNDYIHLGNSRYNIINYTYGDGNDTIVNFDSTDKIQITTDKDFSKYSSGNDYIIKFDTGSITVKNMGRYFSSSNIVTVSGGNADGGDDDESVIENINSNTLVSGTSGDDYIDNGGDNVTIMGLAGNDTIENVQGYYVSISGGAGNDYIKSYDYNEDNSVTITGGKGNDTIDLDTHHNYLIQYSNGDGNDIIYGLESTDTLQIAGSYTTAQSGDDLIVKVGSGKITLKYGKYADSVNIVTVSGGSSEKNSWTLDGTAATYGTSSKTLATVKGAKSKNGLGTPADKKITLKNSALSKKVTVSGSYEFDFASGYKNATISGTKKNDTITARGSNLKIIGGKGKDSIKMVGTNQTVSGGNGADVFIYAADGGNEKITDFSTNDTLKIGADGSGTYSTVTSGDNIIVSTDDGGKITLVGAVGLSDVNISGTKKNSGEGVKVKGRKITLTEDYSDASFSLTGNYKSAVTVDASAVLIDLNITGNNYSNRIIGTAQDDVIDGGKGADTIYGGTGRDSIFGGAGDDELHGGKGKDTLWGGAGDDELYGDAGNDVFYYNTGEGNDTIFGYEATVDKIILGKGSISNVTTDRNNNVIFTVGDGQLVVNNCADRTVKIVNSSGNVVKNGLYEP